MRRLLALLAVPVLACSGSPTGPSVPAATPAVPVAVVARDGITGEVVNASVQQSGGMVSVTAPGFLTRQQPAAGAVYLWGQSDAYVRHLVYTDARPLIRWRRGRVVTLSFAAGLERYEGALREHAAKLAAPTGIAFALLPSGSSADVTLSVDPAFTGAGFLGRNQNTTTPSGEIVGSRITFASEQNIGRGNTMLHEFGHAIGLGHSIETDDVMCSRENLQGCTTRQDLGSSEYRALTMMYAWRKAGNTFPDSEPQGLASSRSQTYTIACR